MKTAIIVIILMALINGCSLPEVHQAYCNDAAVVNWTCFKEGEPVCCEVDSGSINDSGKE